ncbi:MAG: FtsX-like permease family protein [Muribaculaceae bacterium]|nr:FtsX-like permease family protein [Muribaculaceae bacterium]
MSNNELALRLALRYLWSRKSHSAVTAIAIAGVCGVAVATMAIICVLSVFNGFNEAIVDRDTRIMSDLMVRSASSDIINNADSLTQSIAGIEGVEAVTPVIVDEAVAFYNGKQLPVRLLGVDPTAYRRVTAIDSVIVEGSWKPQPQALVDHEASQSLTAEQNDAITDMAAADFDEAALFAEAELSSDPVQTDTLPVSPILVSSGVAGNLGLPHGSESGIMVYLPRRNSSSAFTDPSSSFMVDSLAATGVFSSQQAEFDAATIIADIEVARRLLEYDTQANVLYISLKDNSNQSDIQSHIAKILGPHYTISTRTDRQTLHFRMVAIEKWITFLLLAFILVIASFNIISTLSMLIIEKRSNIHTMTNYGASRSLIGRVFFWESIIVCMVGSLVGLVAGIILCMLQQHFGLISIPGNPSQIIMSHYPVSIRITDILIVFVLCAAVALIIGAISASFARRTAKTRV